VAVVRDDDVEQVNFDEVAPAKASVVDSSVSLERTADGRRITVAARLRVAPGAAWDALVDTATWPEWGPSVTAVDCDRRRVRSGTRGRVRLPGGVWVPFRVTDFEAGRRWRWRVARVPATGHRVEPVAPGRGDTRRADAGTAPEASSGPECRVVFELSPLAAGYTVVCRRALDDLAALLAA